MKICFRPHPEELGARFARRAPQGKGEETATKFDSRFNERGCYAAAGLSASAFPSAPGPESMPLALVSRSTNSITATGAESP